MAALTDYATLLGEIKNRIHTAQVRTAMAGNTSLLMLYWEIGAVLADRQKKEGWGTAVLPRLAKDLHNELPEEKGFSARNLRLMMRFFEEYPDWGSIWQRAVAQLPWAHNVILIQKVKDLPTRLWYAQQAFEQGWSRDVLALQIQGQMKSSGFSLFRFRKFPRRRCGILNNELNEVFSV